MRALLCLVVAMFYAHGANCQALPQLPAQAYEHLPKLVAAQQQHWPDAPTPWFLAGQIEQESCISLTHSKCWNPKAELKTARENGIGLGQFTRAYNADGSIRFDVISDLAKRHESLRGWNWERRYDINYQLIAIVEMDKAIFGRQRGAGSPDDQIHFTLSAYNGGEGGLLQDRRLCGNTKGCDPSRWFGHVERTSLKTKKPGPYRKSFFEINREYVSNNLKRREKYKDHYLEYSHDRTPRKQQ